MASAPWPAPTATAPVVAEVRVPGSKSVTNRALVLGALAAGTSTLHHPLRSRDTALMVGALRALGADIDDASPSRWTVVGGRLAGSARDGLPLRVDVGNAGTVLRFVPPVAALVGDPVTFDGDPAARRRPVGPLLAALRTLGVTVIDDGDETLPFTVHGSAAPRGGCAELDASSSSQLVSALLLAGAAYDAGVQVRHVGDRAVPNTPHIAMTVAMLRARGVRVTAGRDEWAVAPGPIAAAEETVEPDLSSAAPFLAAAVVTGGEVRIPDWPASSSQPGAALPELLERFGATCSHDTASLVVRGGDRVRGAELDLRDAGELTPVLTALAALADSPSRLLGIDYLRGHETDRLAALAREVTALGGAVTELADGLAIMPRPLHGGMFATYDDHRLAMAAAVLGLVVPGVLVENVATTAKTMPEFVTRWSEVVR